MVVNYCCIGVGLCLDTQSRLTLCNPWNVGCQAPLPMWILKQEYWGGLQSPLPGTLPSPRMKPRSPAFQEDSLPSEPPGKISPISLKDKDSKINTLITRIAHKRVSTIG